MERTERMDCHRAIVRAAMQADDFELVGEFNRSENEEYGYYVFWNDSSERIMLCELNEDDGSIEYGEMEDFVADKHVFLKEITEAIDTING